jgi:hypothetical protein
MTPKRKRVVRIIVMLSIIWFASALPVPFILGTNPTPQQSEQFKTYLEIAAIIAIPFTAMGIAWTLKPELTTRG